MIVTVDSLPATDGVCIIQIGYIEPIIVGSSINTVASPFIVQDKNPRSIPVCTYIYELHITSVRVTFKVDP